MKLSAPDCPLTGFSLSLSLSLSLVDLALIKLRLFARRIASQLQYRFTARTFSSSFTYYLQ